MGCRFVPLKVTPPPTTFTCSRCKKKKDVVKKQQPVKLVYNYRRILLCRFCYCEANWGRSWAEHVCKGE